jgi:5'(3')-deoxyribonucleotidase
VLLWYYIDQGVETKEDEALYEAVGNEFDNRYVKAKERADEAKKALLAKIKEAL